MKNLSFFLALFFILLSCGTGSRQTQEEKLQGEKWDAVMANHDIVMPMMGDTHKIKKGLKAFRDNQSEGATELITNANNLIADLEKADESMMDWMHDFKKLGELQGTMSHEEILGYLDQEDQTMKKVKNLFDTSIEQGKAFLKNNQ